jgi:antigen flippase
MAADYYPRLTELSSDHAAMRRLVNEQTEVCLLLAVPGLMVTLVLAPWLIRLFYTVEFLPASDLLQWLVLGCLGKVISMPLGFVMLALKKPRLFFMTETTLNGMHLVLIWFGLAVIGLEGVAMAFFFLYLGYTGIVYGIARHLIGFAWSPAASRFLLTLLPAVALAFATCQLLPLWPSTVVGTLITGFVSIVCLKGLIARLGAEHRYVLWVLGLPGMRKVCGVG